MGRLNVVNLYARVKDEPKISINIDTGEYNYGMVFLDVVRGNRSIDDDINYLKHDYPILMGREKEVLDEMSTWHENSVVLIKGVLSTARMPKSSFCPNCRDERGNPTKNVTEGNFVYVTPIFVQKVADYKTKTEATEDIVQHKEISNQIYVLGYVLKEPKMITTKNKVQITQYPIAINRKYTIKSDDPTIKTDWPVVKSYGKQARQDKTQIMYQSEVIIDGILQARRLVRKCKCPSCGKIYEWQDNCMEIVPYDVEYVSDFRLRDDVEKEFGETLEEHMQKLYDSAHQDDLDDDMKTIDTTE